MPRYRTQRDATGARLRAGGRALSRSLLRIAPFLALSFVLLPLAHSQHGGHGGGHASAPHMAAPRYAPQRNPQRPAQAPAYRGAAPVNAPNRFSTAPVPPGPPSAYRPGAPYPNQRIPTVGQQNQFSGQHLGGWLQSHQGQSFASQENALRQEPGFSRLPQQQQQRLINQMQRLEAMPPRERQRTLGRNENFERLNPEQRQAVRGSAQELSSMDPARRQQVRGAFRALRDLPPGQRQQVLNSPAYRSMYSDHERQILGSLLSVEPYEPR